MNLQKLDEILDAVEKPRFIMVNGWLAEFYCSDKRKRGRMIRQKRKREVIAEKNKLHNATTCGKIATGKI